MVILGKEGRQRKEGWEANEGKEGRRKQGGKEGKEGRREGRNRIVWLIVVVVVRTLLLLGPTYHKLQRGKEGRGEARGARNQQISKQEAS